MTGAGGVPPLDLLVEVADATLPDVVRQSVPLEHRRSALSDQLAWRSQVASQDSGYARDYRAMAPVRGAVDDDYRERWLRVSGDLSALAGPRFRALDLEMPFVGISAASRAITERDLVELRRVARAEFAVFSPRYVALWSGLPAGAWPGTRADSRLLAAPLGALRARSVPAELGLRPLADLSFYEEYLRIYEQHHALRPAHRVQARPEPVAALADLIAEGTVWSVEIAGQRAGVLAARRGVASGCRGVEVVELVLAPDFCGRGHGAALSVLIARAVKEPGDHWLFGTIHADNLPAYRAARSAGRIDIGGEILLDL